MIIAGCRECDSWMMITVVRQESDSWLAIIPVGRHESDSWLAIFIVGHQGSNSWLTVIIVFAHNNADSIAQLVLFGTCYDNSISSSDLWPQIGSDSHINPFLQGIGCHNVQRLPCNASCVEDHKLREFALTHVILAPGAHGRGGLRELLDSPFFLFLVM